MATYRVFFRNAFGIVGRQDFSADDEGTAVAMAEILCDACSDRCDSFEVWNGTRCILGARTPRSALPSMNAVTQKSEATLRECEEAIRQSQWGIASSQRLLMRLAELRAQLAA